MFKTPRVSDLVIIHDPFQDQPIAAVITKIHDPSPEGCVNVYTFPDQFPEAQGQEGVASIQHKDHAPLGAICWDYAR